MDVPLRTDLAAVYHVGNLNDQRTPVTNSHEGRALSIGLHPGAWRRISEVTAGTTYELSKCTSCFVDYQAIGSLECFSEYGQTAGLVKPATVFRLYYTDPALDERCYFEFDERIEAEAELDDPARIDPDIDETKTIRATDELADAMNYTHCPTGETARQLLLFEWVSRETAYDGVWFDEVLDPANDSAPRGGIIPNRLSDWSIEERAGADWTPLA